MEAIPILLVSHCILNTAAKVYYPYRAERDQEAETRTAFLQRALERGVQLLQLPCPEFTVYGPQRWGHTREQFDNPFFRAHCRRILAPVLEQVQAYLHGGTADRFRVLGVIGVEGSPSCGISYTCSGGWGGELSARADLAQAVAQVHRVSGMGVLMEELSQMLAQAGITLPMIGLHGNGKELLDKLLEDIGEGRAP